MTRMLIMSGLLLFLLAACATQNEKMMKTGKKVVEAIAGNDYPQFRKMMGRSLQEMSLIALPAESRTTLKYSTYATPRRGCFRPPADGNK